MPEPEPTPTCHGCNRTSREASSPLEQIEIGDLESTQVVLSCRWCIRGFRGRRARQERHMAERLTIPKAENTGRGSKRRRSYPIRLRAQTA